MRSTERGVGILDESGNNTDHKSEKFREFDFFVTQKADFNIVHRINRF
jgi:hypothetical protein